MSALAGIAMLVAASPAAARNSFEGTCKMSGELTFAEPLGNVPSATSFTDVASGTCTGTLNGVSRQDIRVTNRATGSGTLGCLAGHATTSDTLTFARRAKIRIGTEIAGGVTQFGGPFHGAFSGEGVVEVNVLPYTDQAVLAACSAGALRSARYDLVARTITPIVG